ncbi:MAG: fatty acid desaturase [Pseudomonadales bacterium]
MKSPKKPPLLWIQSSIFSITLLIALIAVPWYGLTYGYHWTAWLAFILLAGANGMSITAGYHRLWSHNAYKAKLPLRLFFALFGAAALQNSILIWASGHRRHHRHVDDENLDPYCAGRGLWFSHIGWMLRDYPSGIVDLSNVKDLQRDPVVVWQDKHYALVALSMNFLPPLLLGLMFGDYLAQFLLAGVLRLVFSHHTTFFINSLAHFWGKQPYTNDNTAKDNGLIAALTYGEGYHNFHHRFQTDYRNGVRWWHYDPTKWLIGSCQWLGLTSDLKRTPNVKIREALIQRQFESARSRLPSISNADQVRIYLEKEYQQFSSSLQEWRSLREQWYEQKRAQLESAREDLQKTWTKHAMRSRIKELEYALKLQQKRLRLLNLQLAG